MCLLFPVQPTLNKFDNHFSFCKKHLKYIYGQRNSFFMTIATSDFLWPFHMRFVRAYVLAHSPIIIHNRVQSVSNGDYRAIIELCPYCLLNKFIGLHINGRCCFV